MLLCIEFDPVIAIREFSVQDGVMHDMCRKICGRQSSSQSQKEAVPVKGRDHQRGTRRSRGQ
jgi:hypothetical protein